MFKNIFNKNKCNHCWHIMANYKDLEDTEPLCNLKPKKRVKTLLACYFQIRRLKICCACLDFKTTNVLERNYDYVQNLDWWPETKEEQIKEIEQCQNTMKLKIKRENYHESNQR